MWQWQPSPQISGVISALCAGCCRAEIQFATAQMGEAIASVPQYHMQKCLVCFNTDKADIFQRRFADNTHEGTISHLAVQSL